MKKAFLLLPILGLLGYIVLTSNITGPGMTSGLERTGATGTAGCGGSGCHAAISSGGSVSAFIQVFSGATAVTSYTPGATYTIHLSGMNSSTLDDLPRFGFQMSVVKAASTSVDAGTLSAIAGTHTVTASGITVVEHGPTSLPPTTGTGGDGTTYEVDIPWTAPVAGTGSVKIFAVLNAVTTLSGADAGDKWSTWTATLTEGAAGPVGPITGTLAVCAGSTTTLANSVTGGSWSSMSPANATVGATTGIVTGVSPGTATINYNAGAAGIATAIVTVNAMPAAIGGTPTVCIAATTTLTSAPTGGTWTSGTTSVATIGAATGVVTGVTSGTAVISYTNAAGCSAVQTVTVNASGAGAIAGLNTVCVGTTLALTNPTPGGVWSKGTATTVSIGSATGIVTGIAVGTANITYTATNACGTATVQHSVSVLPAASCPTSIGAAPAAPGSALLLSPNPSKGTFTIKLESAMAGQARVTICNLIGVRVKEFVMSSNNVTDVHMEGAVAGIYVIAVSTGNGIITKQVIME